MKYFHIILPTLNFKVFYNKFFKSIKVFEKLKEYFSFGICFQDYSQEQIDIALNEFNKYDLDIRYIHKQYEKPIKMSIVRNDCAQLNPYALYYMIIDDDLWYDDCDDSVLSIINSMIYLLQNDKCGVLSLIHKTKKTIVFNNCISKIETFLGMFIKNIYPEGMICDAAYIDKIGGYNDIILSYPRLMNLDYYAAIAHCRYGHHVEAKPRNEISFIVHGWARDNMSENSNNTELKKLYESHPTKVSIEDYNFEIPAIYTYIENIKQAKQVLNKLLKAKIE